ncbi:MAG TPA: TIGR00725 family protein [Jatrophihabitantaceae bacterium]|jgi:uncharacterized protein (TIGR00725 family)
MRPSWVVAVIGPGHDAPDDVCALARQVGLLLARRGVVVVTGGLGGVMAAAASGVRDGDGLVIGLLPGEDRTAANEHLSITMPTGLGQARNALVVGAADGVIAVGGSWGTLGEVALAYRAGKPVVCLRGWHVTDAEDQAMPLTVGTSPEHAVGLLADALHWPPGTHAT